MKKIVMALSFLSSGVYATTLELNKDRLVEVIDEVDGSMIGTVVQKLDKLSASSPAPIDMLINSPGGSVFVGTSILDAMNVARARGSKIRCVVGALAASMAFIILSECDERYTLPNAKLLFHPVSTGGQGRLQEMIIQLKMVDGLEQKIMKRLQASMRLEWKQFHMFYFAEVWFHGHQLADHAKGFLTMVDDVKGTDKLFVVQRERASIFGKITKRSSGAQQILEQLGFIPAQQQD